MNKEDSNLWLRKGELFSETKEFLVDIQYNVIGISNYQKNIVCHNVDERRLCGNPNETIKHTIDGCRMLAQREDTHPSTNS